MKKLKLTNFGTIADGNVTENVPLKVVALKYLSKVIVSPITNPKSSMPPPKEGLAENVPVKVKSFAA